MNGNIKIDKNDIIPTKNEILSHQGVPSGTDISSDIESLVDIALGLYNSLAKPEALVKEISAAEFADIFYGDGNNSHDAVLINIYPDSISLALFALTVGKDISNKISELFSCNDFALAVMLDAAASVSADKASDWLSLKYQTELNVNNQINSGTVVLSYSPGYCGWNITGQKKLFEYLNPERIGIAINESCLMTPVKSVSGVLVCADKEVHIFEPAYSYCSDCRSQSCLERINKLKLNL